jgi:hypothetical protein
LEDLIAKQTVNREPVLVVIDDVLGNTSASNNSQLLTLFTIGRHIGISVIVLSQSLTRVTIPAIKENADIIAFSNLTDINIKELKTASFGGLKSSAAEVLEFVNSNTGVAHNFAFAVYIRLNAKIYIVRAAGGTSVTPDITPPPEPAAPAITATTVAAPTTDDELADKMAGLAISLPAATPAPAPAPAPAEPAPEASPALSPEPSSEVRKLFMGRRSFTSNAEPEQDLYETPSWAVEKMVNIILESVPRTMVIWEPCHGNGRITNALRSAGFTVIFTDFYTLPEKHDFMEWEPEEPWDILVTNPPYFNKEEWMNRAHSFNKPWLFLYPMEVLATKYCHMLSTTLPLQVWIEATQMKFTNEGEEKAVSKGMIWIGGRWATDPIIKYLPYGK